MQPHRTASLAALAATLLLAASACDDDPSGTVPNLSVTCPTATLGTNDPISITFNSPVSAASISAGNLVVSNASTGVEVQGSLALNSATAPNVVVFTPGRTLPFDSTFRIRVQNVLGTSNQTLRDVAICLVRTPPPPITELFWRSLPSAGGGSLRGVSLVSSTLGYVTSVSFPLFRRENTGNFQAVALPPYFNNLFDVGFVTASRGFVTLDEQREFRTNLVQTTDGGVNFDTVLTVGTASLTRVVALRTGAGATDAVAVAVGVSNAPLIVRYNAQNGARSVQTFAGGSQFRDVDFSADLRYGVASTLGSSANLGYIFVSTDTGKTWTRIESSRAPGGATGAFGWRSIAVNKAGVILAATNQGYVARFVPSSTSPLAYGAPTQVLIPASTPNVPPAPAIITYNDVEFAPDNDAIGWVVGQFQTTGTGTQAVFRGLIFQTRDGGLTWTRQGVRGGENFGADFDPLNRVDALNATTAWTVGEGGVVLEYRP